MSDLAQSDDAASIDRIKASVAHARRMLASQMPAVQSENFDLLPAWVELQRKLYLVGVMWRFNEQYDLPLSARDRGFNYLTLMLTQDGASLKDANRQVAELYQSSTTPEGQEIASRATVAILAGYKAEEGDGSLAALLAVMSKQPGSAVVTGAPWRLLARSKPIAAILFAAGIALSLLLGRSWLEAFGIGAVLGVSTLAIANVLFSQAIKPPQK